MTVAPPAADAGGGVPLVLRLARSRGLPRTGTFVVPPEGSGVAAALQLGGVVLTEVGATDANRCFISRLDGQWVLFNRSRALLCALNGQRIGLGKRPALFDGDVLEFGLLRFEVDALLGGGPGTAEPPPPPWVRLERRDPFARAIDEATAEFELRHLAQPPDSTW
jgi:hypothetical protein